MQIITVEDQEFPTLLSTSRGGKALGKYWRKGQVQIVCATRQFLMVLNGENPSKIAIKPTRSQAEAESIGLQVLKREQIRGNPTEIVPENH